MLRRILEVVVGLVVVAAVALSATLLRPMALPRVTVVEPPRDQRLLCSSPLPGTLYARAEDALVLALLPNDGSDRTAPLIETVPASPLTVRGVLPSGGVFVPGPAQAFVDCQQPASSGLIQVLDASTTSLLITNPDSTDAAVDLSLYGPEGERLALGSRGVVVGPQRTRTIALSVLAGQPGPLSVSYTTSRGRVAITAASQGGPAAVPMQAAERHLIPGIAAGRPSRLLLSNPGTERATAEVYVLGAHARLQPAGGSGVSIPAGASLMIDLTAGIAGEAAALEVVADRAVGATLVAGTAGSLNPASAGGELRAFGPGGGQVQLSNPGEAELTATLTTVVGDEQGVESTLVVPGGTTVTQVLPEGAGVQVSVSAPGPLVGALVYAGELSVAAIPFLASPEKDPEPITAELVPTLR
ncbi:MAG TPA: DUF5719 family protein [Arachnia sp.]|nr:DUF5719 family protein [Arachnia sp.]HMT86052.1 DUF5719 family protein [Arachnia sp.]